MGEKAMTAPKGGGEPGRAGWVVPARPVSAAAVVLYGRIAAGEQPTEADAVELAELLAWGYVTQQSMGGPIVPLNPMAVGRRIGEGALGQLSHIIDMLRHLPEAAYNLNQEFAASRYQAGPGSEFIATRDEVNARVQEILAEAKTELLSAHPQAVRTREQMRMGIPRDTEALKRGVEFRTLYRDSVRDDPVTCEWASTMGPLGVKFRTQADQFERLIIVDRKVAVIRNHLVEDAPPHSAWIITDAAMVAFIVHAFEQEWRRSLDWDGSRRSTKRTGVGGLTDLQYAILWALGPDNCTQQEAADRLHMGLRSLQRELDLVRSKWKMPDARIPQLTCRLGQLMGPAGGREQDAA